LFLLYNQWSLYETRPGVNRSFKVKVGEKLKFKTNANASTGYKECSMFENQFKSIQKTVEKYVNNWKDWVGLVGAGGTLYRTYKAIQKGRDTIRFASIPPASSCNCTDTVLDASFIQNEFYILVE
jgi:predicted secreted protein